MTAILYIKASNDVNGNPRRGWLVITSDSTRWVEGGYRGFQALRDIDPVLMSLEWTEINVSASEYRRLRKDYR